MRKKILMGSIIAIAIIVLSSFSSVVAKSSADNDLVEFDVEFCGLNKKHTVKLTQQEAEEVELLFDDIEQRLSEVETREEAEVVFNEAIFELDKFGLFGDISIQEIQNIVFNNSNFEIDKNNVDKLFQKPEIFSGGRNLNCLIAGETTNSYIIGINSLLKTFILVILAYINVNIYDFLLQLGFTGELFSMYHNFLIFIFQLLPHLDVHSIITIGEYLEHLWGDIDYPSEGWLTTIGLFGIKKFSGRFYGRIGDNPFISILCGVIGFSGIKFGGNIMTWGYSWYLGSAKYVHISYEPPYF